MLADSIISNTISEEIRQKGHLSIRFSPDGCSVLVTDASYRPALLKRFSADAGDEPVIRISDCLLVAEESGLLDFQGEIVFVMDTPNATLVPHPYFDENSGRSLLEKNGPLEAADLVLHRQIRNRSAFLLFAVPGEITGMQKRFSGKVSVIHSAEALISLADQVQASDHQRGMVLVDVQPMSLDILVIREDKIRLLNKYALSDASEFIYHTLNTMTRLGLDRESVPVYLSGMVHEEHELFGLLGKYIRTIRTTPYYMEELARMDVIRHMVLSEASKCA